MAAAAAATNTMTLDQDSSYPIIQYGPSLGFGVRSSPHHTIHSVHVEGAEGSHVLLEPVPRQMNFEPLYLDVCAMQSCVGGLGFNPWVLAYSHRGGAGLQGYTITNHSDFCVRKSSRASVGQESESSEPLARLLCEFCNTYRLYRSLVEPLQTRL